MTTKRRRIDSITNNSTKRTKFTIEQAILPDLTKSGLLLVTGAGDVGQLGLGSNVSEKSYFTKVPIDQEIVDVCAGGMHTVCLTKEGNVLTFGCNDEGALGRNTADVEDSEFTPGKVDLPGEVIQISAGDSHTAALLKNGQAFVWGTFRDSHGNMGLTPNGNEKLPYQIGKNQVILKIASGADHLILLTNHGEVLTCGCAEQGQLGRTTERGSSRNARSGAGVDQLSKLLYPAPISLKPNLRLRFEDIWGGTYSSFAKVAGKSDVFVFGLNNYNQLGLKKLAPQFTPTVSKDYSRLKWKLICGAQHHSVALTEDGKTYSIGRKEYGRLGLGTDCDDARVLTEIPLLKDEVVVDVSCGSTTSFAVTEDGKLYAWGMGSEGQLGTGKDDDCFEPTLIKSKQLTDLQVFRVSSGGQHTVILAYKNSNNHGNSNSMDAA